MIYRSFELNDDQPKEDCIEGAPYSFKLRKESDMMVIAC